MKTVCWILVRCDVSRILVRCEIRWRIDLYVEGTDPAVGGRLLRGPGGADRNVIDMERCCAVSRVVPNNLAALKARASPQLHLALLCELCDRGGWAQQNIFVLCPYMRAVSHFSGYQPYIYLLNYVTKYNTVIYGFFAGPWVRQPSSLANHVNLILSRNLLWTTGTSPVLLDGHGGVHAHDLLDVCCVTHAKIATGWERSPPLQVLAWQVQTHISRGVRFQVRVRREHSGLGSST